VRGGLLSRTKAFLTSYVRICGGQYLSINDSFILASKLALQFLFNTSDLAGMTSSVAFTSLTHAHIYRLLSVMFLY